MTDHSTVAVGPPSEPTVPETRLQRVGGSLLLLTPVLLVVGMAFAMFMVPFEGGSDVDIVTSQGWLLF